MTAEKNPLHPGALAFYEDREGGQRGPVLTLVPDVATEERRLSVMMQSTERDYRPLCLTLDDVQALASYCLKFILAGRWVHRCKGCDGDGLAPYADLREAGVACAACGGTGKGQAP